MLSLSKLHCITSNEIVNMATLYITCKFKAEIFIFLSHVIERWHIDDFHIINVCLAKLLQLKAWRVNVEEGAIIRA